MNTKCHQCRKRTAGTKFCCPKCKWTWHNRNRTLSPNVEYNCKVCGKRVSKWVSPQRIAQGIVTNEYCSRTCAGIGRTGSSHFNWKGGRRQDKDGYWLVYMPTHKHANHQGMVREHRLVMERHIGRPLKRREVVHHINDDPSDNRIENLKLYRNNAEHKADDCVKRVRDKRGRLTRKE